MIFDIELSYIKYESFRNLTRKILEKYLDKMIGIPGAKGSRYHPMDEQGKDGFILHIKRVIFWVIELAREHDINPLTRDAMIFAALFHDLSRTDLLRDPNSEKSSYPGHGRYSWEMIKEDVRIANCIAHDCFISSTFECTKRFIITHMTHWDKKDPNPESINEYLFATADYIASRKFIKTPILKEFDKK